MRKTGTAVSMILCFIGSELALQGAEDFTKNFSELSGDFKRHIAEFQDSVAQQPDRLKSIEQKALSLISEDRTKIEKAVVYVLLVQLYAKYQPDEVAKINKYCKNTSKLAWNMGYFPFWTLQPFRRWYSSLRENVHPGDVGSEVESSNSSEIKHLATPLLKGLEFTTQNLNIEKKQTPPTEIPDVRRITPICNIPPEKLKQKLAESQKSKNATEELERKIKQIKRQNKILSHRNLIANELAALCQELENIRCDELLHETLENAELRKEILEVVNKQRSQRKKRRKEATDSAHELDVEIK